VSVASPRTSGRRAVLRWAWRLFRREWRQQALVLALMTVAVAAAVAGSIMVLQVAPSSSGQFGNAAALVHVDGRDPEAARDALAAAAERFGDVEVIAHSSVDVPGSTRPLDVRDQGPNGALGRPMLDLVDGRYPTEAGEVALSRDVAGLLSAGIGDHVELGGVGRTVVGLVENPGNLTEDFALVAPGMATADSFTVLAAEAGPSGRGTAGSGGGGDRPDFQVFARGEGEEAAATASVLVVTTLAMALVGLVAAAGFVVVAQRRQRQLGVLSAIGATDRHLRLVMLADGAIVGAIAALIGALLGLAAWLAAVPAVETAANHRVERFALPWGVVAGVLALAVAMATAAAWWPARTMARLPVTTALSGRPTRPLPVRRSLAVAVVLLAAGVGGIAAAGATEERVDPRLLIAGILAVVVGTVLVAPAAVRGLAAPARRLPFAARLALRDLARYQARAAAALAAITLGLGISVAVVAVAGANEYRSDEGNLSDRQVLVLASGDRAAPDPDRSQAELDRLDDRAATVAAALGGDTTTLPLDVAVNPAPASAGTTKEPVSVGRYRDADTIQQVGTAYVATPEVLGHYGIDADAVADGTELLTSQSGDLALVDTSVRPDAGSPATHVQHVALPRYTAAPNSLVTEAAMARHGWAAGRAGWLLETPEPLTSDQVAAARAAAADAGLAVGTRSSQDGLAQLRTSATAGGMVLALAIVAMAIGLIRSESAGDLRTLTATGAAAATRRSLTASTAGALAVLGVVLGTGGAYAALLAAYHGSLGELAPLPAAHLFTLAVGVPVAASAAGWLLAGREPRSFARQAFD
jgi:putative ABC transport system permease protein